MAAPDPQAPLRPAASIETGVVSIVIPCYRQAHFLAEAIESALNQSYPKVEVIVVDDGSPDEAAAIAARYPVRYLEQENAGLAAARNTGLAASRGEFVVFLDADDRLLPDAVRENVARLVEDPSLGFVAGASRYIARDGTPMPTNRPHWPHGDVYADLLRRNRMRMPAMVTFRRSVFDQVGGFDSSVDACADYDMYLRVSRRFAVAFHDGLVAEYRRHGENMSLDPARMLRQMTWVLGRQRQHVRDDAVRRAALEQGRLNVQQYYGDQLAERIRNRVRARSQWHHVAADAARLLVLYPRGLIVHVFRKTVNWSRRSAGDEEGEAATPDERSN
jgi:glycosyltransferase involved in cell wall biosynthesis